MYLFENTMKKEYKSDDFICPKSRIEKMKTKQKSGESKSEYQYLQGWNNEKATKQERYYNTLFFGQAVLSQSSNFKSP